MKTEIIQLIGTAANRSPSDFTVDNTLEDDLLLEEMDLLLLQLEIEELIERDIDDVAWLNCKTVQDIITLAGGMLATH